MPALSQDLTTVLMVVGALACLLALREIYAARQGIRHQLRLILRGVLAFIVTSLILREVAPNQQDTGLLAMIAAAVAIAATPKRSRYIPAKERRRAIARFEAATGEKYDPKKHDVDHLWPFVRGGSHTADNLRVLSRRENRRKGKRKPKLWDWL